MVQPPVVHQHSVDLSQLAVPRYYDNQYLHPYPGDPYSTNFQPYANINMQHTPENYSFSHSDTGPQYKK